MKKFKFSALLLALAIISMGSAAKADLTYSNDFESYDPAVASTLGDDGWQVGANVFDSGGQFLYNYFSFPAPNTGGAFSGVATGQSGPSQGANVLNTFNDYNNNDHFNGSGNIINALLFRDIGTVAASDVGVTYRLTYDVKAGNLTAPTETAARLNTIETVNFSQTGLSENVTTAATDTWATESLEFTVDASQVGHIFQLAFSNTTSGGADSGIFYDNISIVAVPEPTTLALFGLAGLAVIGRRRRN